MLSHYFYGRLGDAKPKHRRRFDWGSFLAPIFVSPIVFLPLASILETTVPTAAKA